MGYRISLRNVLTERSGVERQSERSVSTLDQEGFVKTFLLWGFSFMDAHIVAMEPCQSVPQPYGLYPVQTRITEDRSGVCCDGHVFLWFAARCVEESLFLFLHAWFIARDHERIHWVIDHG